MLAVTVSSRTRVERERLVESHVPLVHSLARRYAGKGESLDELVQVGALGLVKAAKRFDQRRGVAFATFAAPVIEGEIRRHLRDRSSLIRIPRDLQRASGEMRDQRAQMAAATGRFPSSDELAVALDTDRERIERALRAELTRESVPLADDDQAHELFGDSDDRLSIATSMRVLDERARKIVFLRFHADLTERDIARELDISQAQVSRLLKDALSRLRAELAATAIGGSAPDSTVNRVISQRSKGDVERDRTLHDEDGGPNDERSPAGHGRAPGNIAGMSAAQKVQKVPDVASYLELPYTVSVQLQRDGESARWNATVEELPGCAAQGRTADEAVELLHDAMRHWLEAALAQGREIPLPGEEAKAKASSTHSGRFLVRMPGTLHTQLAQAAEREELSLNRFVIKVLASSISPPKVPEVQQGARSEPSAQARARGVTRADTPSRAFRLALAANVVIVIVAAAAAIALLVLALHNGV